MLRLYFIGRSFSWWHGNAAAAERTAVRQEAQKRLGTACWLLSFLKRDGKQIQPERLTWSLFSFLEEHQDRTHLCASHAGGPLRPLPRSGNVDGVMGDLGSLCLCWKVLRVASSTVQCCWGQRCKIRGERSLWVYLEWRSAPAAHWTGRRRWLFTAGWWIPAKTCISSPIDWALLILKGIEEMTGSCRSSKQQRRKQWVLAWNVLCNLSIDYRQVLFPGIAAISRNQSLEKHVKNFESDRGCAAIFILRSVYIGLEHFYVIQLSKIRHPIYYEE